MGSKDARVLIAVLLAACGPSESAFVVDYTAAYCAYYLDCGDPALLVFDGVDTLEDCQALFGPGVADQASICKVDHGSARHCLDELEVLACPAEEGALLDDGLPLECTNAWKKCLGEPANGEPSDSGE